MGEPSIGIPPMERPPDERLDSWKGIAAYLNRDVTTVQRWEKREGMPVHRHVHAKRGSVYALSEELDAWVRSRRVRVDEPEKEPEAETAVAVDRDVVATAPQKRGLWIAMAAVLSVLLAAGFWLTSRHRVVNPAPSAVGSLAVLPLRNLSGDPGQDYLAEGITEAVIGRLSNIHSLRVSSHTSVMRFKGQQLSVPEIAKSLGVDAIVEGSVIKEGDHIRVTAQLIRGATDEHFWSETYDREMRDALTLESDLAQSIAQKVEVTVTGEEHQRLASARPVAPEVYESYLKGKYALAQINRPEVEQSIVDFEDALKKDDSFAPAYLGLAEAYANLGTVFAGVAPEATRPKVIENARKALELDPNLVEAHTVLGNVLQREWHWAEAEAEFQRALALNPNDADAQAGYALWLVCQGRTEEAVAWIERARALDPVGVPGEKVAMIMFHAHRYEEGIRESRSVLAVRPQNGMNLMNLGFALLAVHQAGEAIPVLERAVAQSPGSPASTGVLIRAYAEAGRHSDALKLLAQLKERSKAGYIPPAAFVNAYLGLGDQEQAFYWLERAYKEQSNILQFLKTHPFFDPLRNDPRFVDLVHRVGLG